MSRRGLIIGKFYPPHKGHKYLIDTARSHVDELHIVICQRRGEVPSGELRLSWLREIHPGARVLLVNDDDFDPADSAFWARQSIAWLGFTPDVVFTSEEYGDSFAACLGCQHFPVDKARQVFRVSGSQVRNNPFACWNYLDPPVRGYYARRICIVGAESTGKTTLARELARHFKTVWIPEYGREVSERKLELDGKYHWESNDFVEIAAMQCRLEDAAARQANRILICDTDAFATTIWHQRYLGYKSAEVESIANSHRRPDLYLLTDVETPFVQDGTRDGESIREWMHNAFITQLSASHRKFILLSGSYADRLTQAIKHAENCLGLETALTVA